MTTKTFKFTVDGDSVDEVLSDFHFNVVFEIQSNGDFKVTEIFLSNEEAHNIKIREIQQSSHDMKHWMGQVRNFAEALIEEDLLGGYEVKELERTNSG